MKLRIANCELRKTPPRTAGTRGARSPFAVRRLKVSSAFTLVEMILAVGIAALVLIAVNLVLFTALHLRDATEDMVNAEAPVDSAAAFIERDLQCCVTPTNGTSKVLSGGFRAGNNLASAGVSDPVAVEMFTATGALGDNAPWGDIQRVTYELKTPSGGSSAAGKDLYRSVLRNLLASTTQVVDDQLMLSGVASVKFSCYDGTQWNDTWDTTSATSVNTNLPLAVRVDIQMAGNAKAQPVEIVVPIDAVSRTNMVLATTAGN
jgi:type II secretion system protein J